MKELIERIKAMFRPKSTGRTIHWHEMSEDQQAAFNKAFATLDTAFVELDKAFDEGPSRNRRHTR